MDAARQLRAAPQISILTKSQAIVWSSKEEGNRVAAYLVEVSNDTDLETRYGFDVIEDADVSIDAGVVPHLRGLAVGDLHQHQQH